MSCFAAELDEAHLLAQLTPWYIVVTVAHLSLCLSSIDALDWSGSPSAFTIYFGVVVGRLIVAFADRDAGYMFMIARSAVGVLLYLSILIALASLPIPAWGVSAEFVGSCNASTADRQLGEAAHVAVAWATLYFLCTAAVELLLFGYAGNPIRMSGSRP